MGRDHETSWYAKATVNLFLDTRTRYSLFLPPSPAPRTNTPKPTPHLAHPGIVPGRSDAALTLALVTSVMRALASAETDSTCFPSCEKVIPVTKTMCAFSSLRTRLTLPEAIVT